MSADTLLLPTSPSNPFEAARTRLIRRIAELPVPNPFAAYPRPIDFEAAALHIREAAELFDEWLTAVGGEVAQNAVAKPITQADFAGLFTDAVDGNCAYLCEAEAEALRDGREAA